MHQRDIYMDGATLGGALNGLAALTTAKGHRDEGKGNNRGMTPPKYLFVVFHSCKVDINKRN